MNNDESQYELFERIAILLENNPDMTEEQAKLQAERETQERQ